MALGAAGLRATLTRTSTHWAASIPLDSQAWRLRRNLHKRPGARGTAGLSDNQALKAVLSQPENLYLARHMCWVFSVGGVETYLLRPRDRSDLHLLLEAVRPNPNPSDYDVIIGQRGPLAPAQMCNGLVLPVVVCDQLYSFDLASLVKSIPVPEKVPADKFTAQATELFLRFFKSPTTLVEPTNIVRSITWLCATIRFTRW